MTDKELKAIYEYMGWCTRPNGEHCPYCGYVHNSDDIELDSNSAWEVVQEMERKQEWRAFYYQTKANYMADISHGYFDEYYFVYWLFNPENFFNCFPKWMEEGRGKNE